MFKRIQSLLFVIAVIALVGSFSFSASAQQLEILDCSTGTYLGVAGAFDCAASTGGTSSYSVIAAPSTLNPVTLSDTASGSIQDHIFGSSATFTIYGILAGGATGTVPQVASVIEVNEDATEVTYTIRDGLTYSDGSAFTMDDIIYWYEDVVYNPNLPNSLTAVFACAGTGEPFEYEVLSANQLKVSCPDPFRTYTGLAAAGVVMSKQMALDLIENQGIGTEAGVNGPRATQEFMGLGAPLELLRGLGPYIMTDFDSQNLARFERNPFFYEVDSNGTQLPYLDNLEVIIIPTAGQNLSLSNFLAGQTDVIGPRPPDIAPILGQAASGGFGVNADIDNGTPAGGRAFVGINYDDPSPGLAQAARNPRVKQALSLAVDRVAAVNNVLLGIGLPQYAPIGMTEPTRSTFFIGRNQSTCADYASLGLPCDDATNTLTVRTGLAVQAINLPPLGLSDEFDRHLQCLVDLQSCIDLANQILDEEGYGDSDGDGIRNLLTGENWETIVTTNSGNTTRVGYTQIVCDGWRELNINCSATETAFATLVAQLTRAGGATWSGGIVIGLTGNDPAGQANSVPCGTFLHFWHNCDPDATSGPTAQPAEDVAIQQIWTEGFSAGTVEEASVAFDEFQTRWMVSEPFIHIAVQNALFATRVDRLCNDARAVNGFDDVKFDTEVAGNAAACATNVGR